jgi:hypothetical protein
MNKVVTCSVILGAAMAIVIAGCNKEAAPKTKNDGEQAKGVQRDSKEAMIQENLARLSPEDRKIAEAQKYCAVENKNRLGGMGVPFKLVLKGKTVFLCCDGCKDDAEKEPDKTLAKAEELRSKR